MLQQAEMENNTSGRRNIQMIKSECEMGMQMEGGKKEKKQNTLYIY